jgi:hypothetical protein
MTDAMPVGGRSANKTSKKQVFLLNSLRWPGVVQAFKEPGYTPERTK